MASKSRIKVVDQTRYTHCHGGVWASSLPEGEAWIVGHKADTRIAFRGSSFGGTRSCIRSRMREYAERELALRAIVEDECDRLDWHGRSRPVLDEAGELNDGNHHEPAATDEAELRAQIREWHDSF